NAYFDIMPSMQPLLIYGLSFLCGISVSWVMLLATLYLAGKRRLLPALLFALTGYIHYQSAVFPRPDGHITGVGHLRVHEVSEASRFYKTRYIYKGVLKHFETDTASYRNLFVVLSLPEKGPPMDREWVVRGTLNGT